MATTWDNQQERPSVALTTSAMVATWIGGPDMAKSTCNVPVCERHQHGGGMCAAHYLWARKHGGEVPTHAVGALRLGKPRERCAVGVCDRPRECGTYCGGHYAWTKWNPGMVPTHAIGSSWRGGGPAGALARHSAPQDPVTGCIDWTGCLTRDGYGSVVRTHGTHGAHRLAWLLRYGSLPDAGYELDHLCLNRRCVNTDHLEVVTSTENKHRATRHRRVAMDRYQREHARRLNEGAA